MTALLQTLLFGLATGAVISLSAVGLSLSYGVTRFINFSYGELLTLGAYLTFVVVSFGLSLPLAAAVGMVAVEHFRSTMHQAKLRRIATKLARDVALYCEPDIAGFKSIPLPGFLACVRSFKQHVAGSELPQRAC